MWNKKKIIIQSPHHISLRQYHFFIKILLLPAIFCGVSPPSKKIPLNLISWLLEVTIIIITFYYRVLK